MGGGPKSNSNVPIVDVPKWLRRGGVRPIWDNVLNYGFFFESIPKGHLINNKMIVTVENLNEITQCKIEGVVKV